MDAFSLLYSKLLLAKLRLFAFGSLLTYVAALFVTSVCRLLRCQTPFLKVADSKPILSKFFTDSRFISTFSYCTL